MMWVFVSVVFFGIAAVWFGVTVFRTSSMVRSALSLLGTMASLGAIFLVLQAEFLGVLQLMMMATEMTIMAIFMVMYMMDPGGTGSMDMSHQKRPAKLTAVLGAAAAVFVVLATGWGTVAESVPAPNAQLIALGHELMQRSLIIFETAGVTILTAMIAATAVAIARRQ